MRAIEQGRYLARAANTGISGIVDPYGRVVVRSSIFEQVGLVGEARFLTSRTVYSQIGDMIAYRGDRTDRAGGNFREGTPWISMTCYGDTKI